MADMGTVLVVDDDVILARAFARALTSAGYRVQTAHNAEEALRALPGEPPDAIIVDFRMPMINGIGFLYRLRKQQAYHETPVMVITGDTLLSDEIRAELRELGAELRLKPVGLEDLLSATRQLLACARPTGVGPRAA
jgi:DNA-binding response OmpR family regulator